MTRISTLSLTIMLGLVPAASQAQIFWTYSGTSTTDEIRRADLDGQNAVTISNPTAPTSNPSPWAIALHVPNQHVFYSDIIAPRTIYRADFTGPSTPMPIMTTTSSVFGIAVDSGNNQLYLSAQTSIIRAGVDGSNQQTLLSGLLNVEGIALDLPNNRMYFVERDANRIARANLDGTNLVTISDHTSLGSTTERGLALASNGKLFFADAGTDNIYMVNTNDFTGTPLIPTSIVNLTTLGGGAPNGVATDNTYVYWTEGSSPNRGIYRAHMDGTAAINYIPQAPGTPIGVGVIPVPEPTSLMTMLVATGGAYFHNRKRSRSDNKTAP